MRHVFLVLDMSNAMENRDLKPNRLTATVKVLSHTCVCPFYTYLSVQRND